MMLRISLFRLGLLALLCWRGGVGLSLERSLFPEFHHPPQTNERYIVLIIDMFGLANRLRAIADWYVVAKLSNRKLVLSWRATPECNASFSDLFESWPEPLELLSLPLPYSDAGLAFLQASAQHRNVSYYLHDAFHENHSDPNMLWRRPNTFLLRRDLVFSNRYQAIFTNYNGVLMLEDMPCQLYKQMRGRFLSSLVPVEEIRITVDNMYMEYFADRIFVGVHIRVHDNHYDWEVVPPVDGSGVALKLGDGVSTEHFAQVIQRISNHFATTKATVSNLKSEDGNVTEIGKKWVRFLVASNRDSVKDEVMKFFGDEVMALRGVVARDSVEGIRYALIEWLLLSRARLLVHTYGSSFAVEAGALRETPTLSILSQFAVFRESRFQPFCGDNQVADALMVDPTEVLVREGTMDERMVASTTITLQPCDALRDWGLENNPNPNLYKGGDYLVVNCMMHDDDVHSINS